MKGRVKLATKLGRAHRLGLNVKTVGLRSERLGSPTLGDGSNAV